MPKKLVSQGVVHAVSTDLKKALQSNKKMHIAWEDITPLARNEWICWITSAKKKETRDHRLGRAIQELSAGKRRPCCWPGCPHRKKV